MKGAQLFMLSLTRIFLHNWHRFTSLVLDIQDGLYLTGHNGSGKSTILDAIQVVLLADLNLIKFNSSAQERSERTLNGFVRGKITETRWLRPGNCVGYIVLEFTDTETEKNTLLGCCIEAGESLGPNGERTYFILHERLDTLFFLWEGQPRTRSLLKKAIQRDHIGKYYDTIGEYQDDLLVALGNLHRRFFDRFRHAFSFTPITNVNRFVEEWLLNEHPLELQNLLLVVNRLEDLRQTTMVVGEKIALLSKISEAQSSYQRFKFLQSQFELLHALLQHEEIRQEVLTFNQTLQEQQQQLNNLEQADNVTQATLQGAKHAREEAAIQLYGLDVVKQRETLSEKIRNTTHTAETLLTKKKQLLQDLHNVAALCQSLLKTTVLTNEEQASISALTEAFSHLTHDTPFFVELPSLTDAAIQSLQTVLERIRTHKSTLDENVSTLEQRIHELDEEMKLLTKGASLGYPPYVEILRDKLEVLLGQRPSIVCELLEVPDERWQTAVEALLGERRFLIVVPIGTYEQVLQYLEKVKRETKLHGASVLDLEKAYREKREALPGSLASEITSSNPYIHAYIDSILGNVITCHTAQEVRHYRRAITTDLIYYNEWAVRILPLEKFRVWFIGQRARISQIAVRRQEHQQKQREITHLLPQRDQARQEEKQLESSIIHQLLLQRKSLDAPPEDGPLRLEIAAYIAEHDALDMSHATFLAAELKRLDTIIAHEEQVSKTLAKELGNLASAQNTATNRKDNAEKIVMERQQTVHEVSQKYPTVVNMAEKLFQEQKGEADLAQVILNADRAAKSFVTQAEKSEKDTNARRLSYNINYHFAGIPENLEDGRYQQELERLQATELPHYESRISQAKQEAEQELREHVLHILRERIANAKDELQRMNEALKSLTFHGDHYQFRWYPADTMREYHDLIINSQLLGAGSLFESEFYQNNQETFDKFYEELTRAPKSDTEKKAKERLTDYRTFLEYDIEIKHADLTTSRLSRIAGETSGGETQTPFYVAVAASFVQLYHIMDEGRRRRGRPTIRLAIFDEAFNRMDQDRIGVTLDMLQQFGLQIITATPLERCEYLVPKICTNVVLTRVREEVHIDEYNNYAAKLEEMYAEGPPDTVTRSEDNNRSVAHTGGTA